MKDLGEDLEEDLGEDFGENLLEDLGEYAISFIFSSLHCTRK